MLLAVFWLLRPGQLLFSLCLGLVHDIICMTLHSGFQYVFSESYLAEKKAGKKSIAKLRMEYITLSV